MVFQALWNTKEYLWDQNSITDALLMVLTYQRHDLLDTIMKSRTMLGIFRQLSLQSRNHFLGRFLNTVFPLMQLFDYGPECETVFRQNLLKLIDYQSSALRFYAEEALQDHEISEQQKRDMRALSIMFAEDKPRLTDLMWTNLNMAKMLYISICQPNCYQPELKKAMEAIGIRKHMSHEELH